MIVVVPGHRLESARIHDQLRARVDAGIRAFEDLDASQLVFSGGRANPSVDRTECGVMGDYAVREGVDPDRIVLDPFAYDTIGNAYFTRVLADDVGLDAGSIRITTDDFHADRTVYAFEHCFGPGVPVEATHTVATDVDVDAPVCRRKLAQTRRFFDGIAPGDAAAIRRRLHEEHDCYEFPELETARTAAR
ncbi:YdcF family protein [Halogeometricum luteum]|uniref:YdcF family protein n=1 Tax=Halogeometricum luteum TaxID=2950537 RepID=A0ABU2G352_9EURY|nr:YdcF family protein [Halogeometricum sp. S3BR5-2]MDS0295203.1 YdcF family protein [Halogeometricum sp. S3BR5-2]